MTRPVIKPLELTEEELITVRVALSRLAHELEKPAGILGSSANAEALRHGHLRNVGAVLARLSQRDED